MKFIFSFLCTFIFISPVVADNICETLTSPQCTNTAGCGWDDDWECTQCVTGTFSAAGNNTCMPCESEFNAGWATQHKAHPNGAGSCDDFICTDGYVKSNDGHCVLNCSGITEPKFLPNGEENCDNWQCSAGYYRGGTNDDECKKCPNNSDNCTTNGGNYGLTTTTVTCESGYIKSVSNGIVTCSTCPEHAVQSGNTCKCNKGYYYGNGNTCTACPSGTTSALGSDDILDCQMTTNTQFCDANGENCMKLLSGATNIN